MQATILSYLTLVLCQFMNLLLVRSQGQPLLSRYLWSNKKLLAAFAISLFCIVNIIYNPVIQPYFNSGSLTGWDWLSSISAAGLYTLIRLLHRHTKATSHTELIRKHGAAKVQSYLRSLTNQLG
jgi:magnesium-transporting ATPase (P-type)